MRIREGRDFREEERNRAGAIVDNETMVRLYWPNRSPVGDRVYIGHEGAGATVVGVVADARRFKIIEEERHFYFYRPLAFGEGGSANLLVRMQPGASRLDAAIRRAMLDLDPTLRGTFSFNELREFPSFLHSPPCRLSHSRWLARSELPNVKDKKGARERGMMYTARKFWFPRLVRRGVPLAFRRKSRSHRPLPEALSSGHLRG